MKGISFNWGEDGISESFLFLPCIGLEKTEVKNVESLFNKFRCDMMTVSKGKEENYGF